MTVRKKGPQSDETVLVHEIAALFTPEPPFPVAGSRQSRLLTVENAAVLLRGGVIAEVGPSETLFPRYRGESTRLVSAKGWLAMPALVEPHTHLVFAGSREDEFHRRLSGAGYLDILRAGGGILETVRRTRGVSEGMLRRNILRALRVFASRGVALLEAKSGYALDRDGELRLLRLLREADGTGGMSVVPTFLGAHSVPPEFAGHPDAYIDFIVREVLPRAAALHLAEFTDVFCEKGVFDVAQSERLLRAARGLGFGIKVHADELAHSGGTALGARLNAASVDHCIHAQSEDIAALARHSPQTVAVLLPATSYSLRKPFAPAREFIERGVPVALATDFNPGTSYTLDPWFVMSLAVVALRMTPEETLTAVTANAASAVGRTDFGAVAPGFRGRVLLVQPGILSEPPARASLGFLGYATPASLSLRLIG
jgi:imidazolonepropionase